MEQTQKNISEIVIPNGYSIEDLLDLDDKGYGFKREAIITGEVKLKFGRDGEE